MDGPSSTWLILLCTPVFLTHVTTIALTKALQSYSRSRLEELTEARGRPERADEIAHHDARVGRAAEAVAVATGVFLAVAAGLALHRRDATGGDGGLILGVTLAGIAGYLLAGVVGRLYAESILDRAWPAAPFLRAAGLPLTAASAGLELLVEWLVGVPDAGARPASVEVEVPADLEEDEDQEPDIPEEAREMMGNVVELTRTTASDIMRPRAEMVMLPSTTSAAGAAETFRATGLSRIPVYGRSRDDIVGILLLKDLFGRLAAPPDGGEVPLARLVREAYGVPETKNAFQLLEEMRARCAPMAVVLDEYGGVVGLVTMEDLVEQVIGPIRDEHDAPTEEEPVVPVGDSAFEIVGGVDLEELNERFGLHLPTDEEFHTVGGLAFHALGRLPEPGASFRRDGVEFTVLAVSPRSIRRLRMDLSPAPPPEG
ncbi:hemolysin family protein [Paludisphaera sp.]|uniref:hemolysin family protein n=1 Tax=Paludisphaera sp. TaxID=2017432 RepID=UPI00301C3C37